MRGGPVLTTLACAMAMSFWGGAGRARADSPAGYRDEARAPMSKKQAAIAAMQAAAEARGTKDSRRARLSWQRQLDARIGQPPGKLINLYNTWTHEFLAVPARVPEQPDQPVVPANQVDRFLRCHFTNQPTHMDEKLLGTLVRAAVHFDASRIDIISGFRSEKYNLILRKKGHQVSRNSQHTHGRAVDFRLPGVPIKRLHTWARRLHMGGVGLYVHSGFIHMDTARVRYWTGR